VAYLGFQIFFAVQGGAWPKWPNGKYAPAEKGSLGVLYNGHEALLCRLQSLQRMLPWPTTTISWNEAQGHRGSDGGSPCGFNRDSHPFLWLPLPHISSKKLPYICLLTYLLTSKLKCMETQYSRERSSSQELTGWQFFARKLTV